MCCTSGIIRLLYIPILNASAVCFAVSALATIHSVHGNINILKHETWMLLMFQLPIYDFRTNIFKCKCLHEIKMQRELNFSMEYCKSGILRESSVGMNWKFRFLKSFYAFLSEIQ